MISETQQDLRGKKYSCVNLVNKYLAEIKKQDKEINAFITVTDELAYKQAKTHDETIKNNPKAFEEFPLLGIVFSIKDLFSTKGIRTTAGSKLLEGYVPEYSATVVERLEAAGAIIIGKANCDAWAHGSSGENSDYGPTKNPHDVSRVAGGSSSGSAASVAAGFCAASVGTDTGGSVRLPASFCGVVGFKPTYGVVSRYGVIAMASSLDSMGHITNSVDDAKKIFEITKGQDGYDSTIASEQTAKKASGYKIGIPEEYFGDDLEGEVRQAIEKAIAILQKKGIGVEKISLPHTKYAVPAYYIIQPAEVSSNLARFDGVRFGNSRKSFGDEAKRRIMLGSYVLSSGYYDAYYLKASKVRTKIITDFDKAFQKVDAIIAPTSPVVAFKIGERADDPVKMYLSDVYAAPMNLAGLPAISIPVGKPNDGLPIGMQIIGPRFGENIIFELGEMYENI